MMGGKSIKTQKRKKQTLWFFVCAVPSILRRLHLCMNLETVWAVILKLFVGSAFYIVTRMIMKTCSTPSYDFDYVQAASEYKNKYCPFGETAFGKAIFVMTLGGAAMALALVYFYMFRWSRVDKKSCSPRAVLLVAIPSALDMVSTAMATFGIPYISLSLAFIFKGARVVFSAILTVVLLKRRLYSYHWTSVVLCMLGLVVAASSQLFVNPSTFVGIVLILGSELFKALRVIIEERLMKDQAFEPTFIVGIEGVYGVIVFGSTMFIAWLAISGSDGGSFENLPDTLIRIGDFPILIALLCIFPILACIASITSAVVTRNLSAVHNGMISVIRVGLLWMFELILYYSFDGSSFGKQLGEAWTPYSSLKLVGFGIVVFSTLLYDEDIKIPKLFTYHVAESKSNTELL